MEREEVYKMFYGSSFIYNNIQSELYDLRIFSINPSGLSESSAGGDSTILEKWLYRREVPYFYGRYFSTPLEFDITVGSFSYIDGGTRHAIESWLLGKSTYSPLRIVQDDISDTVFNCIFTRSSFLYVAGLSYALTLHARCDRPWGISYPPTLTKTYTGGLASETFTYINDSAYKGYNKPVLSFVMDNSPTTNRYISIINASDSNREFRFDSLNPNEEITVDNDKGIITSDTGYLRLSNFNKNFFRLVQGANNLTLSGYITSLSMDAIFAKGIGV